MLMMLLILAMLIPCFHEDIQTIFASPILLFTILLFYKYRDLGET